MRIICALLGHRRDRGHARRYRETWRSHCTRCGVAMVRSAPGLWSAAPEFGPPPDPQAADEFQPCPFDQSPLERTRPVGEGAAIGYLPFPHDVAASIMGARPPAGNGREHYAARAAECRRLAAAAGDPTVELIHLDMATRYEMLARHGAVPRLERRSANRGG